MSKERELLERLVASGVLGGYSFIAEVKELLAQPEQEPVVWMRCEPSTGLVHFANRGDIDNYWIPLYTVPPQPEPLSDEWIKNNIHFAQQDVSFTDLVRAVEKAHGIGE